MKVAISVASMVARRVEKKVVKLAVLKVARKAV